MMVLHSPRSARALFTLHPCLVGSDYSALRQITFRLEARLAINRKWIELNVIFHSVLATFFVSSFCAQIKDKFCFSLGCIIATFFSLNKVLV
jgi:hypothetical protein